MTHDFQHIVEKLLDEDDLQGAEQALLMENEEDRLTRKLGDTTITNYLLKFEQYLDDHDIYLYEGWDDVQILGKPEVQRFWFVCNMWVPKKTDLAGIGRIKTDQEGQNQIKVKKLQDGSRVIQVRVLKRLLDRVEEKSQDEVEEISSEKTGQNENV